MSKFYYNNIKFDRIDNKYVEDILEYYKDKSFIVGFDSAEFTYLYKHREKIILKIKEKYPKMLFEKKKLEKLIALIIIKYY